MASPTSAAQTSGLKISYTNCTRGSARAYEDLLSVRAAPSGVQAQREQWGSGRCGRSHGEPPAGSELPKSCPLKKKEISGVRTNHRHEKIKSRALILAMLVHRSVSHVARGLRACLKNSARTVELSPLKTSQNPDSKNTSGVPDCWLYAESLRTLFSFQMRTN